jgi:hypothetical protein
VAGVPLSTPLRTLVSVATRDAGSDISGAASVAGHHHDKVGHGLCNIMSLKTSG